MAAQLVSQAHKLRFHVLAHAARCRRRQHLGRHRGARLFGERHADAGRQPVELRVQIVEIVVVGRFLDQVGLLEDGLLLADLGLPLRPQHALPLQQAADLRLVSALPERLVAHQRAALDARRVGGVHGAESACYAWRRATPGRRVVRMQLLVGF